MPPARPVALALLLALVPACARPAAPEAPPPAVVIVPEPMDSMVVYDGIAPPPREVPLAAEPSAAKDALALFVTAGPGGGLKVQYPDGQRVAVGANDKLVLPVGRPVTFRCAGEGDGGAFEVPAFGVWLEAKAGAYTSRTVAPTRAGEYGVWNGKRVGTAVVVPVAEFDAWLAGVLPPAGAGPAAGSLAHQGRQLFVRLHCASCHGAAPAGKGPTLEGLYGSKVALKGGGAVLADDQYLIESIRRPKAKVVEGWEAIMPAFDETKATAEELNALVAYIRSLKKGGAKQEERFPAPAGAPTERPKELPPK